MLKSEIKRIQKRCSVCGKHVSWREGEERPFRCNCGTIRWDKPKMEAQLFTLQEKYLVNREEKYFNEIFKIVYQYAHNVIKRSLRNRKILDEFTVESKTQDATTAFLSYYLSKPNFYVTESFGVYIVGAVQYQLYYRKFQRIDKLEVSMNTPLSNSPDDKSTIETKLSNSSKEENEVELIFEKNNQIEDIILNSEKFFQQMFQLLVEREGISTAVIIMTLLNNLITYGSEKEQTKFFNFYGGSIQEIFEKAKQALQFFLEDRKKE